MEQRATFSENRDAEGVGGTFDIEKERGFKVNDTVFGGEILVERSLTNVDIFYLIKLQSY